MATISEEELETYLFNWKTDFIDQESHPLDSYGKSYRQVEIKGYGIIDLLYIDISPAPITPQIDITIVELKKDNIDLNALGQICRYKVAMERFIEKMQEGKHSRHLRCLNIRGVLVGKDYSSGDICYAVDCMEWLEAEANKPDIEKYAK